MPDNKKIASRAGWVSILTNTLLFALKYWAGLVTGSIAIIADAWHTLSDSISSVIVLISIRISRRPPDKRHPFGHGRADLVAAIIIGVILGVIAVDFFIESVQRLISRESVEYGTVALVAIIASILLKEFLAQYAFFAGKKTGNLALKADAWHHRSDALSSVLILVGIFISRYFWWIDAVLGLLVTFLLFHATYKILSSSISPVLGEEPDKNLLKQVEDIIASAHPDKMYAHHFHMHKYGEHRELTFHIMLPGDFSLAQAHDIATRIENEIREKLGIEATIHMEPQYKG
jgi:cation diffusion facilitator family transporter